MRRAQRGWLSLSAVVLATVVAARHTAAQEPGAPPDPRLAREITLEVRAAAVGEVLSRVSAAVGVRAEADARLADQRVTISANNTSVRGLQTALARLFRTTWTVNGEADTARYRLQENAVLRTGATRLRSQRQALFLARLLQTEQALGNRTTESVAAGLRSGVAARMPYLPRESLADITPDFVRQALLLAPLRLGLVATLARTGSASIPLRALSGRHRRLAVGFFLEQHPPDQAVAGTADGSSIAPAAGRRRGLGPLALNHPQARLEYRLVYGDRWTGMLLLIRVGAADTWAEATLPEVLYDVPDYMTLYPETRTRPAGPDVNRRMTLSLDTGGQTWEQALTTVARAANLNVLSDASLRPEVFRPTGGRPVISGSTVGELLDRLGDYYGYVWWKEGNWYLFRNRLWAEEERVAVPEALQRAAGIDIALGERLSGENLAGYAALTDEQLLTLHLTASAAGGPVAPAERFDLNEIELIRAGLTLVAQMTDEQRELARTQGLPYLLMSPLQGFVFLGAAQERGIPLREGDQASWRFRAVDEFSRQRQAAGWAEVGRVRMTFDYSPSATRTTELAVRVPAFERPAGGG